MSQDTFILLSAYLLGSLPFSYLVTKWRTGLDIRQVGEGNAGARNVWHVVGPGWGALVGVLDVGKGLLTYYASRCLDASQAALLLSGLAVVLGHGFPLLRWKQGGKGVAATIGFLLGLLPGSTAAGLFIFCLAHLFLRDFNHSIMVGCAAIILLPLAFGESPLTSAYVLVLMLTMAVKKVVDLPHEQQVWAHSGWTDGATPGFHGRREKGK
jgi:glycerol-3-phosphate acyltransferase PlsY